MTILRLALIASFACNHSQQPSSVPADVRKNAESLLGPSARITSEQEHGTTIYEAATETKLEVELTDKGQLIATEVALPVKALPTAVAAAVKGTISEAEVVVTPTGVLFAVEVGDTEYMIDPSGKIVTHERELPDHED